MSKLQGKIYTIGHGNKRFGELVDILKAYHIRILVDIRSYPGSRRNPHFNREALEANLPQVGVSYEWFKGLGGYRKSGLGAESPHVVLKSQDFRNYADYMLTKEFQKNIGKVLQLARTCPPPARQCQALAGGSLSPRTPSRSSAEADGLRPARQCQAMAGGRGGRGGNTCIMCAETLPFRCHRWFVSDYLVANHVEVVHIIDIKKAECHKLSRYARIQAGNVFYDMGI